ncbi:MAG: Gfo/Idh/MocA family oxidoreductase [Thermoguttaceae bacterium]|jgi:predicted dehydrogenase|nr:Gfo/Idh/MocA family oxidoreductase [Thermoguttaceae bacterium]
MKTAAGAALAAVPLVRSVHAAGSDVLRLAFIGCGGRGTGACRDALVASGSVKLVAMADVLRDRLESSLRNLLQIDEIKEKIDVPPERRFTGFDAYQKAIDCGVDVVLLTTPPVFRPMQYAAAVKAGKHVFMEKPCCVDAPGYRSLVETNRQAKAKKLSVVVGLQRRHQKNYLEAMRRLRDGAVGEVMFLRTYFNMPSGIDHSRRPANMTEMEWQLRRWGYFTWLSGDHIVEQAVHEIDIANWVMNGHPVRANGMGGRQVRTGRGNGQIYDHFCVEYEHEHGVRHFCQARQIGGCWEHVSDNVHGTKGVMTLGSGPYGTGKAGYRTEKQLLEDFGGRNPYQQEHVDLQASIRGDGPYVFDGDHGADSSFTAVLGRMAVYSGRVVTWDEAVRSELNLLPAKLALDADPPVLPDADGFYPVAMPGQTKAW